MREFPTTPVAVTSRAAVELALQGPCDGEAAMARQVGVTWNADPRGRLGRITAGSLPA